MANATLDRDQPGIDFIDVILFADGPRLSLNLRSYEWPVVGRAIASSASGQPEGHSLRSLLQIDRRIWAVYIRLGLCSPNNRAEPTEASHER